MSNSEDRRQRDLDLLKKSYRALEAEQSGDDQAPADRGRRKEDQAAPEPEHDDDVVMYRGRPVRKGSGSIPGAGSSQSRGTQFRGAGGAKKKSSKPASADQLKAALTKLNELHAEGLITQAEFDTKRRQILDRL